VIATWQPAEAAVEETFVNKNPVSTLKLGQARGIALLAPALAGLAVHEYATNAVKSAVVGAGHASKDQVAAMVQRLLPGLGPQTADATDALAVAICHAHHAQTRKVWAAGSRLSNLARSPAPSPPRGEGRGEGVLPSASPTAVTQAASPPHPDPLPGGEREKVGKRRPRKPSEAETTTARQLRGDPTDVEKLLWWKLRARQFGGWKFRRQVPIVGFVADFACLDARLIIELDGGQHSETVERDERRTAVLAQAGFRVLRFWNQQVIGELESVLATIEHALGGPSPRPSPPRGEGEQGLAP